MSKCDTVVPLVFAMKKRRDVVHIAAETIKKLYDLKIPELVEQVGVVVQDVVDFCSGCSLDFFKQVFPVRS